MANPEHIEIIKNGSKLIADWFEANPGKSLDLRDADLRRVDLVHASLPNTDFSGAFLEWADFRWSDIIGTNFSNAILSRADFHKSDMQYCNLNSALLTHTNFEDANLQSAKFDSAIFGHTRILNSDLAGVTGLFSSKHKGPSILDSETIQKSGPLPVVFLQGCGVNDNAINTIINESNRNHTEVLNQYGKYYSVFISYSSKDSIFTDKLYKDLQQSGVRCWYAPEDMKIGDKILRSLFESVRTHEKLLLVLSESSISSDWVEDEVNKAFAEERDRKQPVIFPISLDNSVMESDTAWAQKIRDDRHIGNFVEWDSIDSYKSSFQRLLRDLRR